jgi:hypothetical protein
VTDPFDLDAFIAESEGEPFTFVFGGDTYEMAPRMDIRAIAAMSAGRLDDALSMLLGAEQWERLQKVDAVFDSAAMSALFGKYAEHSGLDVPNSSGSTGSSSSTAGRSRPTSNGRTTPRLRDSSRAS